MRCKKMSQLSLLSVSHAPYRTARHPNSFCRGGKAFSVNASSATRNAFYRGRHTCHARLLAFVIRLTNGPPHMARRARLRPDFGPVASPSHPRSSPRPPPPCSWCITQNPRIPRILLTREPLAIMCFISCRTFVTHDLDFIQTLWSWKTKF